MTDFIDKSQLIRATRLIIALTGGVITTILMDIPMSAWVLISTAIVLFDQETVGGTMNRGKLRITATFLGAIVSLAFLYFFKNNWLAIWIMLAIITFICAYLFMGKKNSYIGLLSIITIAILLIGTGEHHMQTAIYRAMDTIIGVIFAMLSIILFFPQYAFDRCYQQIINALNDIADLVVKIQKENNIESIRSQVLPVETKFHKDIINFNKNLDEARYESKGKKNPLLINKYAECVLQIRRLYRLLIVLFYYELENESLNDLHINHILVEFLQIIHKITSHDNTYSINIDFLEIHQLAKQIHIVSLQNTIKHFVIELRTLNQILIEIQHYKLK